MFKKKFILIILFFLTKTVLFGQTSKLPTKREIKSFTKWVAMDIDEDVRKEEIRKVRLKIDANHFIPSNNKVTFEKPTDTLSKYFSNPDCEYFKLQNDNSDSLWTKEFFPKGVLLSDTGSVRWAVYEYSTPLFSLGKQYVMIRFESSNTMVESGALLPAEVCTRIYKKSKRKWKMCQIWRCVNIF